jgi:hypothetical protein
MNPKDLPQDSSPAEAQAEDVLSPLLQGPALSLFDLTPPLQGPVHGVIIGTLLAMTDNHQTPLVSFPGQPGSAALRARTVVDLHGPHMGQGVVLMFECGDVHRPIVMGVVRGATGWPLADKPATVDVDADGQRMLVSASEQLVLRCGKASITLTKAGKVLIDGTYVSSKSSGVNRVKGGSVQLN